ncbi:hypothetical protein ABIC83_005930, partial [Roseateles asaccharophilus]
APRHRRRHFAGRVRTTPFPTAHGCLGNPGRFKHLLARLQGAAVVAQARRDPEVVHRQVDEALAWLDNVIPATARKRKG